MAVCGSDLIAHFCPTTPWMASSSRAVPASAPWSGVVGIVITSSDRSLANSFDALDAVILACLRLLIEGVYDEMH
jgi:hypothetical protein